jgi:signal transduction histidine kinase
VQAFSLDAPAQVVEASWALALAPPWYRTSWFLGSVALLAAATSVNAWRARRLRVRRLEDAIQADRHRIARDIHDSLEQDLTGLKMQIEAASAWIDQDPSRARGHLDRAADLVGDGMVDARNAVWGLRSAVVPSAELLAALELRLRRVVDPAGVTLSFESAGPSRALPSLTASQLVYIVREAVTNAVKHARPRSVRVAVDLRDPATVRVEVRDDGTGLAVKAGASPSFASGMGLDGMRERVRGLGGTLELASPPEGGTIVKVAAPLRRA